MPITYDDQLETVEESIKREREFIAKNRGKYHSGFIAKLERRVEVLESVKETVRQARANQQMTGMSGRRIDQ